MPKSRFAVGTVHGTVTFDYEDDFGPIQSQVPAKVTYFYLLEGKLNYPAPKFICHVFAFGKWEMVSNQSDVARSFFKLIADADRLAFDSKIRRLSGSDDLSQITNSEHNLLFPLSGE